MPTPKKINLANLTGRCLAKGDTFLTAHLKQKNTAQTSSIISETTINIFTRNIRIHIHIQLTKPTKHHNF